MQVWQTLDTTKPLMCKLLLSTKLGYENVIFIGTSFIKFRTRSQFREIIKDLFIFNVRALKLIKNLTQITQLTRSDIECPQAMASDNPTEFKITNGETLPREE